MLKLVINNTQRCNEAFQGAEEIKIPPLPLQDAFQTHFQQIAHNLYKFSAHDFNHELVCEMNMEIKEGYVPSEEEGAEEGRYLVPVVFCNLPNIDSYRFNEKVWGDEYLQGSIMVEFQLKILEQLLLFCEEKEASHLILTINDINDDYLEIYRPFALSEEEVMTTEGGQTEMTISTDVETYDEVIDFMDGFGSDFRQTLWHDQKANPIFREYLINYSLSVRE